VTGTGQTGTISRTPVDLHRLMDEVSLVNTWAVGILPTDQLPTDRRMSWLDIYLIALFLALVGLLVAKFRG
jgi:hypothetical protein